MKNCFFIKTLNLFKFYLKFIRNIFHFFTPFVLFFSANPSSNKDSEMDTSMEEVGGDYGGISGESIVENYRPLFNEVHNNFNCYANKVLNFLKRSKTALNLTIEDFKSKGLSETLCLNTTEFPRWAEHFLDKAQSEGFTPPELTAKRHLQVLLHSGAGELSEDIRAENLIEFTKWYRNVLHLSLNVSFGEVIKEAKDLNRGIEKIRTSISNEVVGICQGTNNNPLLGKKSKILTDLKESTTELTSARLQKIFDQEFNTFVPKLRLMFGLHVRPNIKKSTPPTPVTSETESTEPRVQRYDCGTYIFTENLFLSQNLLSDALDICKYDLNFCLPFFGNHYKFNLLHNFQEFIRKEKNFSDSPILWDVFQTRVKNLLFSTNFESTKNNNLANKIRSVIFKLASNGFGIFPTDKNLGPCICPLDLIDSLTKNVIFEEGEYEIINFSELTNIEKNCSQIGLKILKIAHENNFISNFEFSSYKDLLKKSELPYFEIILKIHKPTLKARPICRSHNSFFKSSYLILTKLLSNLLNKYKVLFPDHFIGIQNSLEVVKQLSNLNDNCPLLKSNDIKLVTMDVKSLYPSMLHFRILYSIEYIGKICNMSPSWIKNVRLISLLVLKNNFMTVRGTYNNYLLRQKSGSVMGACHSTIEADLYLATYEHKMHANKPKNILLDVRYIDDIFLIIIGTYKMICEAICWIKSRYLPDIGQKQEIDLTVEQSSTKLAFLDLSIFIKKVMENDYFTDILNSSLYKKPQLAKLPLHWESNHPRHVFKGILQGEIIRALRLCSSKNIFLVEKSRIIKKYIDRGWPKNFIFNINFVNWADRCLYLNKKVRDKKLDTNNFSYFVSTFSNSSENIKPFLRTLSDGLLDNPRPIKHLHKMPVKINTLRKVTRYFLPLFFYTF